MSFVAVAIGGDAERKARESDFHGNLSRISTARLARSAVTLFSFAIRQSASDINHGKGGTGVAGHYSLKRGTVISSFSPATLRSEGKTPSLGRRRLFPRPKTERWASKLVDEAETKGETGRVVTTIKGRRREDDENETVRWWVLCTVQKRKGRGREVRRTGGANEGRGKSDVQEVMSSSTQLNSTVWRTRLMYSLLLSR
jgi:hypothetical protein